MTTNTKDPEEGSASVDAERVANNGSVFDVDQTTQSMTENGPQNTNDDTSARSVGDEETRGISLQELIFGAASFHAVVKPVSVTMILAALAVLYINTDQTKAAGERALGQSYQVFTISDEQSAATNLGLGFVNSLIIVCAIGAMTFLIVLLYKYKCMKILIGYMIFASTMLLGFLGGQMFYVAINKYRLTIDVISFYVTMYNFAIVGVLAVFYQKGVPTYITQFYLVGTSVIVAWQLSYFNGWMAWTLLIMLALYDLCAVLTPCGPLKALVKLMSKDDAPTMPGLLYEAGLPMNATRPGGQQSRQNENAGTDQRSDSHQNSDVINASSIRTTHKDSVRENAGLDNGSAMNIRLEKRTENQGTDMESSTNHKTRGTASSQSEDHVQSERNVTMFSDPLPESTSQTTKLPLAIAKVYKLPITRSGSLGNIASLDYSSPTAYLDQEFSASELQTDVVVKLPRRGGRIETARNKKGKLRYIVYNKDGEVRRTLIVDDNGKVLEIVPRNDDGSPDPDENTIKLGLGDFIFYSVLVSKAAENGFASFIACFMSILTGLGGTLVLLAVYHHALPALPISIFLAVIMFICVVYCMDPWIHSIWRSGPFYV